MRRTVQMSFLVLLLGTASIVYADAIWNIRFSPGSPGALQFGQKVSITFDYSVTTRGGILIFPRPFTNGVLTPNYGASPSMVFTGTGTGSGYFTISSGDVTVDHVRFQLFNADQSQLVLEFFVPVEFKYSSHGIYNIQLTPASPSSMRVNDRVGIAFSYATSEPGGVRVYCVPLTGGAPTPNGALQPSPLYPTGTGSGTSWVVVMSGAAKVDAIRFEMWKGDNSARLVNFTVPVNYSYSRTSIQNIVCTPSSPNGLLFNQNVDVQFTYSTDEAAGVRIYVRPYTHGAYTPNYAAHGSVVSPAGTGNGSGWFTITSQENTVDSLAFRVFDAADTNLLLQYLVPVNFHFGSHKVTDISFEPTSPAFFTTGHYDSIRFTYTHNYAGGVLLWAVPRFGSTGQPDFGYTPSAVLPVGSATLTRSFTVYSENHFINKVRYRMVNSTQTETLLTWEVPVQFYFGSQSLVGVPTPPTQPHSFALEQNYPNPFNPSTSIKFELAKSSDVKLSVYDILGREVSVLVNERRDAGVHEVRFDGSNLASGVYFYRLQAGDFVSSKKLLLLK
jgi:hypothetical protein